MNPWMKDPQVALHPGPFREGDHVKFVWVYTPVEGVIIEDRGNIGVGGRRLYMVEFRLRGNITEPMFIEKPADELALIPPPSTAKPDNGRQG